MFRNENSRGSTTVPETTWDYLARNPVRCGALDWEILGYCVTSTNLTPLRPPVSVRSPDQCVCSTIDQLTRFGFFFYFCQHMPRLNLNGGRNRRAIMTQTSRLIGAGGRFPNEADARSFTSERPFLAGCGPSPRSQARCQKTLHQPGEHDTPECPLMADCSPSPRVGVECQKTLHLGATGGCSSVRSWPLNHG